MSTYATPIPGAYGYGQTALAAQRAYGNALARLNQRRTSTLQTAGYRADINPETGVAQNLRTDPFNQYGQFQTLNRSQAERAAQARMAGVNRGLGTGGGLAGQLRQQAQFYSGQEDAAFGRGLAETLAGYQDQQQGAAFERDQALYQAELEAARQATADQERMAGPSLNPADYSGLEYPAYGANPLDVVQPSAAVKKAVAVKTAARPVRKPGPTAAAARFIKPAQVYKNVNKLPTTKKKK